MPIHNALHVSCKDSFVGEIGSGLVWATRACAERSCDAFAFDHGENPVDSWSRNFFHFTAGPMYFDSVDDFGITEAEV